MTWEREQVSSKLAATLDSRWSRRGLVFSTLAAAPFIKNLEGAHWDISLNRYERNFHHTTEKRRMELLGEGDFVPVGFQQRELLSSGDGFKLRFNLEEDRLVTLQVQALPDRNVSAPEVFADFQGLTYQVPILRTPNTAEQQIILRFAERGENVVTVRRNEASDDLEIGSLIATATTPEGFSPIYEGVLYGLGIIGIRDDNFFQYMRDDATPEEKKRGLTNDASFFTELEILEHNFDPNLILVELNRGARSESPRDPETLYNETGRLYDYDPVVLITMDRRSGNIYTIAYQTDSTKVHQVVRLKAYSSPIDYRSKELREICKFHEMQNLSQAGTGHGMIASGLGSVIINGYDYPVDIVTSFVPPARKVKKLEDKNITYLEREIEISRRTIGARANLERMVYSAPQRNGARQIFLEKLNTDLRDQIAALPQYDL